MKIASTDPQTLSIGISPNGLFKVMDECISPADSHTLMPGRHRFSRLQFEAHAFTVNQYVALIQ